jgi:PAS domain S-box-containing protein
MSQRAQLLFESAMDAIVTIDSNQRVVAFNAAAESMFGWPRAEIVGQGLDVLIPERFRARHRSHVDAFARTGTTSRRMGAQAVLAGLRRTGEEFPLEASICQYSEEGAARLAVILRDVTERVRTQSMLAASEARMRGILDSAMDAVITVDERQRVVLFNRAAESMFRTKAGDAIGAPLATFIPQRFREAHASHVKRFGDGSAASRRMADARIVTGVRSDGEEFPIDAAISHLRDEDRVF